MTTNRRSSNQASVATLKTALDQLETVMQGLSPADAARPTPCRSWDVGTLVDHVLFDLSQFTAAASGKQVEWTAEPPHVSAQQWLPALHSGHQALLDAWGDEGNESIGMQVAELSLHCWDLAQATDQQVDLDPELAETSYGFLQGMLQPDYRGSEEDGKSFGPEQPAGPDAGPYERLAAFSGRSV